MDVQTFTALVKQYEDLLYHVAYSLLSAPADCADCV